jgi:hypothetical protein
MSPDWSAKVEPVPYAKLDNPQSLNLYAYAGNNPESVFDPDGHLQLNKAQGTETVEASQCSWFACTWKKVKHKFQKAVHVVHHWVKSHPKTVKAAVTTVIVVTVVSGAFDGGTSEAAVPEEAAVGESLTGTGEAGSAAADDAASDVASTPGGRTYSAHYLNETGPVRNIPGSVVDETIDHATSIEKLEDRTVYYDAKNDVTVVQSDTTGKIMSVRKGTP